MHGHFTKIVAYYTNWDPCRIPGNAFKAMAGLSGTWGVPEEKKKKKTVED